MRASLGHWMARKLVLALGLLAIAAVAAVVLTRQGPRRSGTNLTPNTGFVIPLGAGQRLCEGEELLPGDTGALQLSVDAHGLPGPQLAVAVSGPAGSIGQGSLRYGWRSGVVRIPITRVLQTTIDAVVCLSNLGTTPVTLAGSTPDPNFSIDISGKTLNGRLRIEYMRPGRESWLELFPTIVHRMSLAKSNLVRHWAAGAAFVLMLLAVGIASRTMLGVKP
jgi:hypothetical protein